MLSPDTKRSRGKTGSLSLSRLLKDLVSDRMIEPKEAERIARLSRTKRGADTHPLSIIASLRPVHAQRPDRILTEEDLTSWLAQRLDLPYQRIDPLEIDVASVTAVMSYAYAAKRKILPVDVDQDRVVIAVSNPFDTEWVNEMQQILRKSIERVLANPSDISRFLDEFYSLSRSVKKATLPENKGGISIVTNLEQLVELGRKGQLDAEDHHIVHIVDWLLQYAFEQRASDIHLESRREHGQIRFRIDGVLHNVYQVPPNVLGALINRVKTLGRMDITEKRRPLDGRLKTRTPQGTEIELRLSTIPTALGEKLVMRIFDPDVLQRGYHELGLSDHELKLWEGFVSQPHGIVLVTGPTGSGKTTTLYSTLKQLATPEVNVCTIEDPIEMVEPRFNQIQVQHNIDLDFARGVRALLRQDPDIIMIGEIRDLETAEMAVQASLTGHLVLSTLHTNDAPSAITRLMEIGVPSYLINATVLGIVAQRLVRTLCPHCKTGIKIDQDAWRALTKPWKVGLPKNAQGAKGCLECRHTGYYGRVGIYEIVQMTDELRNIISPDTDIVSVRQQAIKDGMQALRISGARKIAAGNCTLEEVLRVIPKLRYDDTDI